MSRHAITAILGALAWLAAAIPVQAAGESLSGEQVRALISGNTVSGAIYAKPYDFSYTADGKIYGEIGSTTDSAATDHWNLYGEPGATTFLHLDIAEAHIGNNFPVEVGMVGDARASLEFMVKLLKQKHPKIERLRVDLNPIKAIALNKVFNSNIPMPEGTISPVKLSQELDRLLPDNAIVTSEPGVSAIYPSALLTLRKAGRRYITNYSMGALGYSVPAGIGAAYANDGPVISFTGDGSIGFVLGDMETIKRSGKNVTIILTRNDSFGWIRGEAILLDEVDEPWSTEFGAVDYLKIAEGFGFDTDQITSESEIEQILSAAIANTGPSFIEVRVPTQDQIVPFVPNWVRAARKKNLPHFY